MDSEEQSAGPHVSVKQLNELLRNHKPLRIAQRFHVIACQQCRDRLIEAWIRWLRATKHVKGKPTNEGIESQSS